MDVVYEGYGLIAIWEQVEELKKQLVAALKEQKPDADEEKMEWHIRAYFDEDGIARLSVAYTIECEGK